MSCLVLGVWALGALGPGHAGYTSRGEVNVPVDRDGNGLPDWVRVGDYDGDGVLEIDDIQDAMDALTDPGPKVLLVEPGSFAPPAQPSARSRRTDGLLQLRSFTTLQCAGPGRTVLHGSPVGAGTDYAVVANDDHVRGNEEVWVRGCQIDGGAPARYDSTAFPRNRRMGVYFWATRNSGVADSYVHDTVHAGLYTSNSAGDQFLRDVVENVGGYGDTSGTWRQPCIYLFAFGGGRALKDFRALGNTLRRCGHSGLNTRAEHTDAPGDAVWNLLWEDNTVEDTPYACISLRGVDGATVRRLACRRTGPILLNREFGSGYRFQGNDNANANVLIEDAVVSGVAADRRGLEVGAWVDGLALRRVRVDGGGAGAGAVPEQDCAWLERPLRHALIEDLALRNCGRSGAVVQSRGGDLGDVSETLMLRGVEVAEVDRAQAAGTVPAGLDFVGDHSRLLLEDLRLSGARGPELRFTGALSDATLRRVEVESMDAGAPGIEFARGVPPPSVRLEDVTVTEAAGLSVHAAARAGNARPR